MTRRRSLAALAAACAVALLAAACRKPGPPPQDRDAEVRARLEKPPEKPIVDPKAPPRVQELQKRLLALYPQTLAEWEGSRADRARLVRPAPEGFKPEGEGRRLKLALELAKTALKPGERLWYRLELQNVGTEPVEVTDPIFKHPEWTNSSVRFRFTPPGGAEQDVTPSLFGDPDDGPRLDFGDDEILTTPAQFAKARSEQWEDFKTYPVRVLLLPGETVFTKPYSPAKGAPPSVAGAYHKLDTELRFEHPGVYRVRAIFGEPKPLPPDADFIRAMERRGSTRAKELAEHERRLKAWTAPAESNSITFEVRP